MNNRDGKSICLATTWYPRGEFPRLVRLLPVLEGQYSQIVVACLVNDNPSMAGHFIQDALTTHPRLIFVQNNDRLCGRYTALRLGVQTGADYVHYADMDRLLHWVETRPQEWETSLDKLVQYDGLVFGRTAQAMQSHPQALISTELVSNAVVSHLLGCEMDVSAGSKAFSRLAATYLLEHGKPDNSIGTDAEWPILLIQAGFYLGYIAVDGLEYESADQYLPRAATSDEQARAAREYDADPMHWERRVEIARVIIQAALALSRRE